jgi:hypothetical protein
VAQFFKGETASSQTGGMASRKQRGHGLAGQKAEPARSGPQQGFNHVIAGLAGRFRFVRKMYAMGETGRGDGTDVFR